MTADGPLPSNRTVKLYVSVPGAADLAEDAVSVEVEETRFKLTVATAERDLVLDLPRLNDEVKAMTKVARKPDQLVITLFKETEIKWQGPLCCRRAALPRRRAL